MVPQKHEMDIDPYVCIFGSFFLAEEGDTSKKKKTNVKDLFSLKCKKVEKNTAFLKSLNLMKEIQTFHRTVCCKLWDLQQTVSISFFPESRDNQHHIPDGPLSTLSARFYHCAFSADDESKMLLDPVRPHCEDAAPRWQ